MFQRLFYFVVIVSVCFLFSNAVATAACTKDTDCKGSRICNEDGNCVDPPRDNAGNAISDAGTEYNATSNKKASGEALAPCGCWGPIMLGYKSLMPACQSGSATATPCPGMCFGGGSPWHAVCD